MLNKTVRLIGISAFLITAVLFPEQGSSGQSVRPLLIQPGVAAREIQPATTSTRVMPSAAMQGDTVELTPGVQVMGSIPAPAQGACLLGLTQFTFVPRESIIEIVLASDRNVDLYVRFGQRVSIEGGEILADISSVKPTGVENISITNPDPETTYFIAINNCSAETANFALVIFEIVVDPFIPFIISCDLKRRPTGAFSLVITGEAIREGARVRIDGEEPKKVKFKNISTNGFASKIIVKKKACKFLPGIIVVTNPDGIHSQPFVCTLSCSD
ncbi:MAG: hypothetical protein L0229_05965 [Blastocatellia bacterium]|nr:hypothetical protein [Blastocatellia bacterium]